MNRGWLFLILSVLTYGAWGFLAKLSQQKGASAFLLTILTAIGTALVALAVCLPQVHWTAALRQFRPCLAPGILCGLSVGLGNIFLYKALQTVPTSIAYPVSSLYVAVTVLLALFFLGERIDLLHGMGIALAVAAVFLLSK